jgi:hypothetical protein
MTEILIIGNMSSRIGDKQVNLPHAWDHYSGAHRIMIYTVVQLVVTGYVI